MSPLSRLQARVRNMHRATMIRAVAALAAIVGGGYCIGVAQATPAPQPLPAGTAFTTALPTTNLAGVTVPVLAWGSASTFTSPALPPLGCLISSSPTFTLAGQHLNGASYSEDFPMSLGRHGFAGTIPDLTSRAVAGVATVTVTYPCLAPASFTPPTNVAKFALWVLYQAELRNHITPITDALQVPFTVLVDSGLPQIITPHVDVTGGSLAYGQGGTFVATVSQTVPAVLGAIQFKVDGVNLGAPVTLSNASATSPSLSTLGGFPLAAGSHGVEADFVPAEVTKFGAALNTAGFTVTKAATTTALALQGSSAVATVAAVAPGSGTPTGAVSFTRDGVAIGSAQLSNGVATLTGLAAGAGNVAAAYAGDSNLTGSSGSTARQMPTIVATLTSETAKTSYRWYRSPVTVSFVCTTAGSPLTAACPSPVTLSRSGAAQSVTKTILAQDGGAATAVVNGINIDMGRPRLWVIGAVSGQHYAAAPQVTCVGEDTLSGIASCTVTVGHVSHGVVHYTATATDKAGNIKTVRGVYFLSR